MLFGSRQSKQLRLSKETQLLMAHSEISIEQLACEVGVDRATIERDLVSLDEDGVKLYEGKRGRLGVPDWMRRRLQRR